MSEEPRDSSLLIGLHKLAEQNGDGLVPELYVLLSRQGAPEDRPAAEIVAFPPPAERAAARVATRQGEAVGVVLNLRRR